MRRGIVSRQGIALALLALIASVWLAPVHDHTLAQEDGEAAEPCAICVVESAHAEPALPGAADGQPAPEFAPFSPENQHFLIESGPAQPAGRAPPVV